MKIGLKLWSINTDYYLKEAELLYKKGIFDYIELYVVPNTLETIKDWRVLEIPYMLHAPHFAHNVNLAKREFLEYNKKIYKEVKIFKKELDAKYTVVHSGIEGQIEEVVYQLELIKPDNILIENKPYRAPLGDRELCRGYNIQEVQYIIKNINCGFCLDIGHAICTANSLGLNPYEYLEQFNQLQPKCYHLSDGLIDSEVDMHLNINKGTYDFEKIFGIINKEKEIAIETIKNSKDNLDDFCSDVKSIRKFE